jgi:hypothetical protein
LYDYLRSQWFTPIILATWEVEIWRIVVQNQLEQKVRAIPFQPIKTVHGGILLSSQIGGKYK